MRSIRRDLFSIVTVKPCGMGVPCVNEGAQLYWGALGFIGGERNGSGIWYAHDGLAYTRIRMHDCCHGDRV